jgi:hypothetical protein
MVASEQKEIILIFHLVSQKQTDCLQGIPAPVKRKEKGRKILLNVRMYTRGMSLKPVT